ncbi:hypothetical protein D1007_16208 [Hordeum vulgare]|nr:hypothetical protein D1007_16208 [Hordeum vulgare]
MEISLDALLGMQRHGQDLTYRLAQGVSGLLLHVQPPQLPWPAPPLPLKLISFDIKLPAVPFVGGGGVDLPAVAVASFVEIGSRLGQAGSDLGASVGGAVQQLSRQIPVPFRSVPRPPTPPVRSPHCTPRTSSGKATEYERALFRALSTLVGEDRDTEVAFDRHFQLLREFPRDLMSLRRTQLIFFYVGRPDTSLEFVQQVS